MDAKSCKIFEQAVDDRRSTYAPIFLRIAISAGYTASSFPLLLVIKVCIDYGC